MFDKLAEKFVDDVLKQGSYATKEELLDVINGMEQVLKENKDKSLEEIVCALLPDLLTQTKEIMDNYPIPGYVVQNSSGLINVTSYGGYMNNEQTPMRKDAMFDVASITKLFTQIVSYNLIKEGYYTFDSKVSDLDPRYQNATNLDIKTIMQFAFSYNIEGNINNATTVEEANDILHTLSARETNKYSYIDFGMLCLKDVMESVTGLNFEQLVDKYIVNKLGLENTYLNVPKDKIDLVTGTPNAKIGKNNDMKAIKLGGVSGNSGIMASSDDLINLVKNLYVNSKLFPREYLPDVYTESELSKIEEMSRGVMGNACTGVGSFVDKLSSTNASAYQGSTRTQVNMSIQNGHLSASTVLFNPGSMGLERAREIEEKVGKKFVTEYNFEGQDYVQLASQVILPTSSVVKPMTHEMSKLRLKLAFLNTLVREYEPNYNKAVNIEVQNGTVKK